MTRLLTIPSNLPAQLPAPRAPPRTEAARLHQPLPAIPPAPTAASVQALSKADRKEFARQQEIDRRAFQEGGHWLEHVSAHYTEKARRWTSDRAASDANLDLPAAAPAPPPSPFTQPKVPNTYGAGRFTGTPHTCSIDFTAKAPLPAESVDSDESLPAFIPFLPAPATARTSAPSTHVSARALFAPHMAKRARMQYGPEETH
jgi:hypothetical protein